MIKCKHYITPYPTNSLTRILLLNFEITIFFSILNPLKLSKYEKFKSLPIFKKITLRGELNVAF